MQLLQQLPGMAECRIAQPVQLPWLEGQSVQLRWYFVQLHQLWQQLHEQLLFVRDSVDRRVHGGSGEGAVRLLQLGNNQLQFSSVQPLTFTRVPVAEWENAKVFWLAQGGIWESE